MIADSHFECSGLHRTSHDVDFEQFLYASKLPAAPPEWKTAASTYGGCDILSTVVIGTGRGSRFANDLRLGQMMWIAPADYVEFFSMLRDGDEPPHESSSLQSGLVLSNRVEWMRGNPWSRSLLPVCFAMFAGGSVVCFDLATSELDPPLIVVPIASGRSPSEAGFVYPGYVASSLEAMFRENVQSENPESGLFPYEEALDRGVESWLPTPAHIQWNKRRDSLLADL